MVQKGTETSVYLRGNIAEKIDNLVKTDRMLHRSRSQFINSACYRRLRELGEAPEVEIQ